jgi:glycosyltransferase involved in cell wall biosynthesis
MKISVAIPVRNEADNIGDLINRLLAQTRPPDEIVFTDGGSKDGTAEIIDERIKSGAPLKLIRVDEALPGRGRNLAAREACSEWIAFIDAGVEPAPDWLQRLADKADHNSKVDVV